VERRRSSLYLRATLPERDAPTTKRQQRLALGLAADYAALPEAEAKAIELSRQLRQGKFSWAAWDLPEAGDSGHALVLTITEFREAAQRLHASKYRKDPERGANAWAKKWAPALRKLPDVGPATESVLLRVLRSMPEGSAARRDQGNLLAQVAKTLGLETGALLEASRGYGVDKLAERDIPTDKAIEAAIGKIRLPHWRWTFAMCAAYGLRPHECAELEWLDEDWVKVHDKTKTGGRQVCPCHSRWVKTFELHDLPRPTQGASALTKVFNDALDRDKVGIKPYNLRHAYALRLMSGGVPPELGARLMGHSLQVHEQTYKRWLDADRIREAMRGRNL
jgi:integrase